MSAETSGVKARACNLLVPIGTPLFHLLDECEGLARDPVLALLGGPMTGVAQRYLEAPTLKNSNALLLLDRRESSPLPGKDPVCIRCGRCTKACPMNLTPLFFHLYHHGGRCDELKKLNLMDCMECGACAYSCPAHLPLVESIRAAKEELRRQAQPEEIPAAQGKEADQ